MLERLLSAFSTFRCQVYSYLALVSTVSFEDSTSLFPGYLDSFYCSLAPAAIFVWRLPLLSCLVGLFSTPVNSCADAAFRLIVTSFTIVFRLLTILLNEEDKASFLQNLDLIYFGQVLGLNCVSKS